MPNTNQVPGRYGQQVICASCPLLIAVFYTPTRQQPGSAQALCIDLEEGRALFTFFSPMDAYLEAAYSSRPPERIYQIIPLAGFDPRSLIAHNGGQLALHSTLGFAASNGRLITRPDGKLCGYGTLEIHPIAPDTELPIHLTIDPEIGAGFERLHELAGLFAWQDTLNNAWHWDERKRLQEVAAAIAAIPARAGLDELVDQVALYDPEFRQWHFVNLADLTGEI